MRRLKHCSAGIAQRTWKELSKPEQKELAKLEEDLSGRLTAPGESARERERHAEMAAYVDKTLQSLGSGK
jgi:hypothetical protein